MDVVSIIDESEIEAPIKETIIVETLVVVLMNFDGHGIEDYDEIICSLTGMGLYLFS